MFHISLRCGELCQEDAVPFGENEVSCSSKVLFPLVHALLERHAA
jgi:hypothetical protein